MVLKIKTIIKVIAWLLDLDQHSIILKSTLLDDYINKIITQISRLNNKF